MIHEQSEGRDWFAYNGDCVPIIAALPDDSVGFSVYSPPFASLYTYSDSDADMGNCKDHDEFFAHYTYLLSELLRVTKPGRLSSVHCMIMPTSKTRDGVIGLTDFPGRIIAAHQAAGWIYHSDVVIWKDPVTAMQRTKALGLLWKQIQKDSCMSRMGLPDRVVTFRKPGVNPEPVGHSKSEFPVDQWQRWASPVWDDINPSDTLQYQSAREEKDERHICPLQLEVIRRCVRLWSNHGDTVLSPFGGIGSELYVALQEGRRAIACELKPSYYRQLVANLQAVERRTGDLFAGVVAVPTTEVAIEIDPPSRVLEAAEAMGYYEAENFDPPELDADGNAIPPPAYPQWSEPVDDYAKFAEMYPPATDWLTLVTHYLLGTLTPDQYQALPNDAPWAPSSVAFQESAQWARLERAHRDSEARAITGGIAGLTIPSRLPMPEALAKLLKPAKAKRTRKPKASAAADTGGEASQ